jgi:nucleotidyltransferase/DNA polymerase involved in DNA repair
MRVGCFFFPRFAVQVEARNNDSMIGRPIITGGLPYERKAVYDASQEALECGVRQGMPLREAYSLCPQGLFLPLDEEKYANAFTAILTLLADYSPVVEAETLGSAFIDLSYECNELQFVREFGQLIEERFHLYPSISTASNKFVSWVASQVAEPGEPIVIPDGDEREFLEDLPVDLLPASFESLRRLKLFGICKMGELAKLPPEAVSFQFGTEGQKLWELANGIDDSRLIPCKMPELMREELSFEPPAENLDLILNRADELLNRLGWQLRQRWQCCRRLTVSLSFTNDHVVQRMFHFKEATSSKEIMLRHLKRCLEKARFTAPVSEIRLTLTDFCPEEVKQASFLGKASQRKERLTSAISWLRQRYGKGIVKKILPKENSVLPEDSFSLTEFNP